MNKISKIVISLVTSFAFSVSAFAGELSVSGTAKATYNSVSGGNGENTIGVANELNFSAAGELDNGFTWKYSVELDPDSTAEGGNALNDDSQLVITTPMGSVAFCGSECGLSAAGDFNANAYAWITDTGYAEGKVEPTNISSYQNMQYHTAADLLPFSTVLKVAYSPSGTKVNNSANASNAATVAAGKSATMYRVETVPTEGLKVTASFLEQEGGNVTGVSDEQKHESGAISAKYSMDAFTIGIGRALIAPRLADGTALGASTVESYENTNLSIGYLVNDNLSLSVSNEKSEPTYMTSTTVGYDQKTRSVQAAYTMGGMTLSLARTNYDNTGYTQDLDVTENMFAVAMAF
jgi:hypothetical protein